MPADPPVGSLKISEMTPTSDWLVDNVFPCLESGQNLSSTREVFLTELHSNAIALRKANSQIALDANENVDIKCGIGAQTQLSTESTAAFVASDSAGTSVLPGANGVVVLENNSVGGIYVQPGPGVTVQSVAGALLSITDGSSSIKFDGASAVSIESLGGAVFFTDSSFGVDFKAPPSLGMYFTVGSNDIIQIGSDGTAAFLPPSGKTVTLGDLSTAFIIVSNNAPVLGKSFQFGVPTAGTWKFTYNNLNVMALANSGSLAFTSRGTTDLTLTSTTQNITLNTAAGTVKFNTSTPIQALVWLTGLVAANWQTSNPTDHVNAFDRLAAAVAGLLGGPIP